MEKKEDWNLYGGHYKDLKKVGTSQIAYMFEDQQICRKLVSYDNGFRQYEYTYFT
jgi:hypothetical protein